jgi:hypothetical protein
MVLPDIRFRRGGSIRRRNQAEPEAESITEARLKAERWILSQENLSGSRS